MSKEERRRAAARKKQRKVKLAKGTLIGACVVVMPVLAYLAIRI